MASTVREVASKAASLSNAKWGTRFFTDNFNQVNQQVSLLRHSIGMARRLATDIDHIEARRESFKDAVARLELTEEDLVKREKEFRTLARVTGGFMLFAPLWAIFQMSIVGFSMGLAAGFLAGVMWLGWSLRLWQVRNKTLCSLTQFLEQPGWWKEWLA